MIKHIPYFLNNSDDNQQDKFWNLTQGLSPVARETLQNMLEGQIYLVNMASVAARPTLLRGLLVGSLLV